MQNISSARMASAVNNPRRLICHERKKERTNELNKAEFYVNMF